MGLVSRTGRPARSAPELTNYFSLYRCINACFKDNRTVCAQVTEDTVRQFVRLAAQEKAPRFLRFLRMITMPNDQAIKRTRQTYELLPLLTSLTTHYPLYR